MPSFAADDDKSDLQDWSISLILRPWSKRSSGAEISNGREPATFRLSTKLDYFRFAKRIYAGSSCIKQYVFSPLVPSSDSERIGRCIAASSHAPSPMPSQTSPPPRDANQNLQMGRVMSFQTLGDACTSEAAQICRKCLV